MARTISSRKCSLDFTTFWMDFLVESVPLNSFNNVEPQYCKLRVRESLKKISWGGHLGGVFHCPRDEKDRLVPPLAFNRIAAAHKNFRGLFGRLRRGPRFFVAVPYGASVASARTRMSALSWRRWHFRVGMTRCFLQFCFNVTVCKTIELTTNLPTN